MKTGITNKSANLLLAMTSFIWGSGFVIYKNMVSLVSPFQFLVLRAFFAALCSLILLIFYVKRVSRREVAAGMLLGGILAAAGFLQTIGIQRTTAGNCAFLTGTSVVMVPFLAWAVSGKRPSGSRIAAAALMFAGVCLLTVDSDSMGRINVGDLLSFAGAFLFAVHIAVTEYVTRRYPPLVLISLQFLFLFFFHLITLPFDQGGVSLKVNMILPMAYLGIVPIFAGHSLQTICQEKTGASEAAVLLSLEGVFGSIFGVVFLGEQYSPIAIAAFGLIFISIIISQKKIKAI